METIPPKTTEEWEALIAKVDVITDSPGVRAARVKEKLSEFDTYDIICFCILMLPTLWIDILDSMPQLRAAVKYQINLLRILHYVQRIYEKSENVVQREADSSEADGKGTGTNP